MVQIFETQEMLGLYGKSPTSTGNYYIATGDCGHILTGGTLAGMIISGPTKLVAYMHMLAMLHACMTLSHAPTQLPLPPSPSDPHPPSLILAQPRFEPWCKTVILPGLSVLATIDPYL